jgi:hypothetical protein
VSNAVRHNAFCIGGNARNSDMLAERLPAGTLVFKHLAGASAASVVIFT